MKKKIYASVLAAAFSAICAGPVLAQAVIASTVAVSTGSVQPPINVEYLDLNTAIKDLDTTATSNLYQSVAEYYIRANKTDKAISVLETYRRQLGTNYLVLSQLANLYIQRGAPKSAKEIYDNLFKLHPDEMGEQLPNILAIYRQQGDFKGAADFMEAYVKANTAKPEYFAWLGEVYRDLGDWPRAENAFRKALSMKLDGGYYMSLIQLFHKEKKLDKAEAVFAEGLRQLPAEEKNLTMSMIDVYELEGQYAKAQALILHLQSIATTSEDKTGLQLLLTDVQAKLKNAPAAAAASATAHTSSASASGATAPVPASASGASAPVSTGTPKAAPVYLKDGTVPVKTSR